MAVYVDDMHLYPIGQYGRMKMSHLLADTDEELHAMADRIGVARRWWQRPPKHSSHYDIALSKRALAVAAGAIEITMRQAAAMNLRRRITGALGSPDDAEQWQRDRLATRRAELDAQAEAVRAAYDKPIGLAPTGSGN